MRSGSKTISTASAWPGCFLYVGLSFSPPVYPTLVEITPSRWRSSSWTPQKQPPARIAVSVLSVIALSYPRRPPPNNSAASRTMLTLSSKIEAAIGIAAPGCAAAPAVEVEDREAAEDHESGD